MGVPWAVRPAAGQGGRAGSVELASWGLQCRGGEEGDGQGPHTGTPLCSQAPPFSSHQQQQQQQRPLSPSRMHRPSARPPPLGSMHCLYCTEKGRDRRSEEGEQRRQAQRPSPPPTPPARGRGSLHGRGGWACPRLTPCGAGALGWASLEFAHLKIAELSLDRLIFLKKLFFFF